MPHTLRVYFHVLQYAEGSFQLCAILVTVLFPGFTMDNGLHWNVSALSGLVCLS